MGLKWVIAILYFPFDWFIPGIGISSELYELKKFVMPVFFVLVILLFHKSLLEDFRRLRLKEVLLFTIPAFCLILFANRLLPEASSAGAKIVSPPWGYLLSGVTYGPLFEELMFRYCIIPVSGTKLSKIVTLIISAAFFSMAHGFMFHWDMFVFGLILGILYLIKQNIWYPLIVHYVNNLIGVSLILFYLK